MYLSHEMFSLFFLGLEGSSFTGLSKRKDSVFEKVIQELTCLENVYSTDVKIAYMPTADLRGSLPNF
jgi:hypothetical protein